MIAATVLLFSCVRGRRRCHLSFPGFFLVWGKGKMVVLCYLGPSEVLPFFIEIIGDPSKINPLAIKLPCYTETQARL